jgi:hypothetical protein
MIGDRRRWGIVAISRGDLDVNDDEERSMKWEISIGSRSRHRDSMAGRYVLNHALTIVNATSGATH